MSCNRLLHADRSPPWSVHGCTAYLPAPIATGQDGGVAGSVIDTVAAALRARGERMTVPRRAVVEVLESQRGHLTAEQVVGMVAGSAPDVHRATVYRALETLSALGVVQHVHVGHGGTAYHLVHRGGAHPHAQCRSCGAVYDLPPDLLDAVTDRARDDLGFRLDAGHVALSGICRDCARDHGAGPRPGTQERA